MGDTTLLRKALLTNSIATAATGLPFVLAGGALAGLCGVSDPAWVTGYGVFLLGFAVLLGLGARRPSKGVVGLLIAGDLSYVAASAVLVLGWPALLSPIGRLLLVAVALAVVALVAFELVGLRAASEHVPA